MTGSSVEVNGRYNREREHDSEREHPTHQRRITGLNPRDDSKRTIDLGYSSGGTTAADGRNRSDGFMITDDREKPSVSLVRGERRDCRANIEVGRDGRANRVASGQARELKRDCSVVYSERTRAKKQKADEGAGDKPLQVRAHVAPASGSHESSFMCVMQVGLVS